MFTGFIPTNVESHLQTAVTDWVVILLLLHLHHLYLYLPQDSLTAKFHSNSQVSTCRGQTLCIFTTQSGAGWQRGQSGVFPPSWQIKFRKRAHRLFWAAVRHTWPPLGPIEIIDVFLILWVNLWHLLYWNGVEVQPLNHLLTLYISVLVTLQTILSLSQLSLAYLNLIPHIQALQSFHGYK